MIAACVMEPGIFFAINSPAGVVGALPAETVATISSWGFPVSVEMMDGLAHEVGEITLFHRTGGAPSLAIGMATLFSGLFGDTFISVWYHFAIMFEALFILTTLDAGTRVGRFMLQDLLGNVVPALGRTSWYPGVFLTSALVVGSWGYFLWTGVTDPLGGINSLWPLFGISNQMLAAIALCVATTIIIKSGRARYAWVTAFPLAWLLTVTSAAAWEKLFSNEFRIGFLAKARILGDQLTAGTLSPEMMEKAPQLIFNANLNAALTFFFLVVIWIVATDTARICYRVLTGRPTLPSSETPFEPTRPSPDLATIPEPTQM